MNRPLEVRIAALAADFAAPLRTAVASPAAFQAYLASLGWDLTGLAGLNTVLPSIQEVVDAADKAARMAATGQPQFAELVLALAELGTSAGQMASALAGWRAPDIEPEAAAHIATELAADILSSLFALWCRVRVPRVRLALLAAGLMRTTSTPAIVIGTVTPRRAGKRVELDFDQLGRWLTSPQAALAALASAVGGQGASLTELAVTAWKTGGPELSDALTVAGLPALWRPADESLSRPGSIWLFTADDLVGAGRSEPPPWGVTAIEDLAGRVALHLVSKGAWSTSVRADGWRLVSELNVSGGITLTSSQVTTAADAAGLISLETLSVPALTLGDAEGPHIEIGKLKLSAALKLANGSPPDLQLNIDLADLRARTGPAGSDKFIGSILRAINAPPVSLGFIWSPRQGLRLTGGLQLERIVLASSIVLGPVEVRNLAIASTGGSESLSLTLGGEIVAAIGPLKLSIQGIGLALGLTKGAGALGVADVRMGISPPTGADIALNIDSVVSGGGGLTFDFSQQQYSGYVRLQIQNTIDLKVVGILNARLPDGRPGYSLLLIITGEFPAIQLGLGFTLNGVGGLLGINRTAAVDVLRTGLHTGALDAILFPPDPLSNVPALLNTLGSVFPVAEGRYTFGPMAKFGWGSPTILTLDLALILEIPDPVRLLLLGRLKATLPDEKNAVVLLHMDALGVLDFSRSEFSLDATLYDSRILSFVLSGDMAMRLSWGAQPNFLFSVGGFHPHFQPQADMPKLARMAIVFVDTAEARLRLDAYFALTSNTVQFGARADAYLKLGFVEASGFVSFDALFHFSPFTLEAELAAQAAIKVGGIMLLGADLALTLTGPSPWHLFGQASFILLGIKGTAPVDLRIGDSNPPPEQLPDPVDVFAMLKAALADSRNWQTQLPGASTSAVSLSPRKGDDAAEKVSLLAHPLGTISVRQRVVPLDLAVRRYGNAPIQGASYFSASFLMIDSDHPNDPGTALAFDVIQEQFALAQYEDLSDERKLAGPAFSAESAGLSLADDTFASSPQISIPPTEGFDDLPLAVVKLGPAAVSQLSTAKRVERFISMGAATRSPSRATGAARYFAVASPALRTETTIHG